MKKSILLLLLFLLLLSACSKKEPDSTGQKEPENIENNLPEGEIQNEEPSSDVSPEVKIVPIDFTTPFNASGLSTEKFDFSYGIAKEGQPHFITVDNQTKFDDWNVNTLAWDNKSEGKPLYLTFDCGYPYEDCVPRMLDTLKEKGATGVFFCTMQYLEQAPDMVRRMIDEGHIVGNHTVNHPSDCAALDTATMLAEVQGVHDKLLNDFNYNACYFRFPGGTYSEKMLKSVANTGYRIIFWSLAHYDWDPKDQPGVQQAFDTVSSRLHPGAVILLHTTAPDNVAMLGDFIDHARNQGYEFRSLDTYEYWD